MDFRGLGIDSKWRATKQTPSRFSFLTSDFSSTNVDRYKETIRAIFYDNWFPKINKKNATINSSRINMDSLNNCIEAFRSGQDPGKFNLLYDYTLKGLGAGEVLLYLIIDNSSIGGGSSAAIDLTVDGKNFEIKSGLLTQSDGSYHDFRFGGTINDHDIKKALLELGKVTMDGGAYIVNKNGIVNSSLAIPGTKMRKIQEKNKEEFEAIEKEYSKLVKEYFGETYLVVFDRTDGSIKFLKKGRSMVEGDIGIYRIAQGTIEPRVKLKK